MEKGVNNPVSGTSGQNIATDDALERLREELKDIARAENWCRVSYWMEFLPITPQQKITLGQVYAFQCSGHRYRMSTKVAAALRNYRFRSKVNEELNDLVDKGFLIPLKPKPRKPVEYVVDEAACLIEAIKHGYTSDKNENLIEQVKVGLFVDRKANG